MMNILHTALYALLGTAFVFAVIELGLSAHVVDLFRDAEDYYSNNYFHPSRVRITTPPIASFSVFVSVWTMLVSGGALFVSWFFARKAPLSRQLNLILSMSLVGIYFVTMVFWLADFADFAHITGGLMISDTMNAIIAFGVLLWLIFLALLIITVLSVFSVLHLDWPGYSPLWERTPRTQQTAEVEAPANPPVEQMKQEETVAQP